MLVTGDAHGCPHYPRLRASLARFSMARGSLARARLARPSMTRSQFGAFLFGVMLVWRVSLSRVSHFCANVDPVCNFVSASLARTTLAGILCVCFRYVSYCLRRIFIDVIKVSSGVHYIGGVFLWLVHTFIN